VVAAVRGLCHPDFAYHGPASSTGGSAVVLIVNGPIARAIGVNAGNNAFGQGWRANATIGRAVRLVMMNVMGTRPGLLDRATLGTPGKYSFCFAENEEGHPWEPLHVERGLRRDQSAVTVYASNSLYQVYNQLAATPEPLLLCFADALANLGVPNVRGFNQALLVFAGEHSEIFRARGWSKREVKEFVVRHARRRVADFKRAGRLAGIATAEPEELLEKFFVALPSARAAQQVVLDSPLDDGFVQVVRDLVPKNLALFMGKGIGPALRKGAKCGITRFLLALARDHGFAPEVDLEKMVQAVVSP